MKKFYFLLLILLCYQLSYAQTNIGFTTYGPEFIQLTAPDVSSPVNYPPHNTTDVIPFGYYYTTIRIEQDMRDNPLFTSGVDLDQARLYYKVYDGSFSFGTANDASWNVLDAVDIFNVPFSNNDRAQFEFDLSSTHSSLRGKEIVFYVRMTEAGTDYYGFVGASSTSPPYLVAPTSVSQLYRAKFNPAKPYHTIRIDGITGDWYAEHTRVCERSHASTSRTFDVSWDDTYLYFLVNDGFTASSNDRVHIGFDRNPRSGGDANGNTTSFSGASFPENYRVDILFRARGNGTTSWTVDRGVSTGFNTWNYSGDIGNCTTCDVYAVSGTNTQRLEIRIKRSAIGTFTSLGIYVWLSNSSDNLYDSFPFGNRNSNGLLNINWGSESFDNDVSPAEDGYFDAQYQTTSGTQNIGGISGIETFRDIRVSGVGGTTRKSGETGLTINRDLLIESGAIFSMHVAEANLSVGRDVTINGTLTLSTVTGADLRIGRHLTINTGATLNHNAREIIMGGTGEQLIGGSIASFPNISYFAVDNTSSSEKVIVQKPFTITERLRLNDGILQTDNTNFITLTTSAIINRTTSSTENYVDGPIAKVIDSNTTFEFPVGNDNNYQPITIVTNSGSSSTTFKASYSKTAYSNTTSLGTGLHHVSILEHWILDRTSGDRGGKVRLSWNLASDLQGYDGTMCNLSDLKVCRFNGTEWVNEGGSVVSGSCSGSGVLESVNNITSFSPFTLGSSTTNNPLPVKLTFFKGERDKEKVTLSWQTAIEHRNKGFEVERSYDGATFSPIGFVAAKGSGQVRQDYSFSLIEPRSAYYRLKQLDIDDKFEYSSTIFVVGDESIEETFVLYPNPTINNVRLEWKGLPLEEVAVNVFNQLGQKVFSDRGKLSVVEKHLNEQFVHFKEGMYVVRLHAIEKDFTLKLIKQ